MVSLREFIGKFTHPVGSVYTSVNSTSPADIFGGTWEPIKDVFLLAAGSTYTAGATGGAANVTLTTTQIPSHNHGINASYNTAYAASDANFSKTGSDKNVVSSASTKSTGGGGSHNNMPPYLVVYVWKRTA